MHPTETLPGSQRRPRSGTARPDVVGLYMLPRGPAVPLDGFVHDGLPRRLISVGTRGSSDIVLADRAVSRAHCLIERTDECVRVRDSASKNGTYVNGTHVEVARLHPGYVLTLGRQSLVAYGPGGYNRYSLIVAASLHTFIHRAARLHGSMRAAALALGVAPSTFLRWIKRKTRSDRKTRSNRENRETPRERPE